MHKFHLDIDVDSECFTVVEDGSGDVLACVTKAMMENDVTITIQQFTDIFSPIVQSVIASNVDISRLPMWINLDSTDYSHFE